MKKWLIKYSRKNEYVTKTCEICTIKSPDICGLLDAYNKKHGFIIKVFSKEAEIYKIKL